MRSLLFSIAAILSVCAAGAQQYHVLKTYHIASSGGWDYIAVSPTNGNIYVSHSTQVNILDKNTGDSVGVIPNTTGVHGVAFAPAFKKGFTSNGKLNTVTVFDIASNAVEAQINVGENPDAIMYDDHARKVYVCNGHANSMSVIDPENNTVVKTIELDGKPETAVADADHIYVNIEDKNEIQEISTHTWNVEQTWKIGKGKSPSGLAIDVATKRLFAGCDNKLLVVMNAENGKVVKELPIGDGCDGVAFDPGTKTVFSSNGEGTLTVIHEVNANKYTVDEPVTTQKGARTIAVDEHSHLVYLPTAEFVQQTNSEQAPKRRAIVPGTFKVLVVGK